MPEKKQCYQSVQFQKKVSCPPCGPATLVRTLQTASDQNVSKTAFYKNGAVISCNKKSGIWALQPFHAANTARVPPSSHPPCAPLSFSRAADGRRGAVCLTGIPF